MSWSRRIGVALTLALLAAPLAACGFHPLYGERAGAETVTELAAIGVKEIPGRLGYELRNNLIDRLAPEGFAPVRLYELAATVDTARRALAIQPDETTTRYNLAVTVTFALTDVTSRQVLYRDSVKVETSFNVVDDDFSTLVSQTDAERRAARQASEEIRTLLAVYFSRFARG